MDIILGDRAVDPPQHNQGVGDESRNVDRDSLLLWGLSYGRRQMGTRNICNAWLYSNQQRNQPWMAVSHNSQGVICHTR